MSLHAWEAHHQMDLTFEDCKLTYILTHRDIASIFFFLIVIENIASIFDRY
jgi:hypothetical protein